MTVVEAGPALDDPALLARTANGLQLPIGVGSPLVRRYQTQLTERPARRHPLVRGATIGGSGAINGGYFCRGLPRDFDRLGLPGWAWSDVLDSFRAIETDLDFDGPAHGRSGPILVRRTREMTGTTERFIDAARRAGFGWIDDLNDAAAQPVSGIGAVPLNIVDGVRKGSGAGYLIPALSRPNLRVQAHSRVARLRADVVGPHGRATLTADRIVLCAGAIETAHLLMLSGIGEPGMLRAAGVPVRVALPVGTSFSDHAEWVLPTDWPVAPGRPVLEVVLSTADHLEIRPYTGGFVAMTGDGTAGHADWPHLGVALMQPRARGCLTLVSADPAVPPRIEHSTSQHLCGTAPMGVDGDPRAVVDPRCRVRGIDNLWVIDGSVLPAITSRGPHATIVMIGHRAAEFVR